jgi:NAD(P)-dependent dehydrogenase (short-subunit alcohol dehydrogenase family)
MKNKKAEQKKSSASMAGKVCVITGATSGVGLEALKKLAEGSADIIMVCRNIEKGKVIKEDIQKKWPVNIDIFEADFSILADVRRAASEILAKYKQIHVLINSAGLHSTTKVMTREGFELVLCVNHLASFLFTKLLMERMKESAPARIIQVNSEGHRFNGLDINDLNWNKRFYTGLRGYGASKTAQLLTVWELADELKGSGVTINALHPGDVRTNIGSNNGKLYKWFLHNVTWHSLKEPSISGEAIYYLAADPDMLDVSGKFFHLTIEEKPAKHALNRETGKKIFDLSMHVTGLESSTGFLGSGGVSNNI